MLKCCRCPTPTAPIPRPYTNMSRRPIKTSYRPGLGVNTQHHRSSRFGEPQELFLYFELPRTTSADMIIRLGRLTPGYFRLLQRQVAGEVQTQPQDRAVNQIAMMLAIIGLGLSYYSAKQMTEKAQPAP